VTRLEQIARQARLDILEMSLRAKAGHVPSALSMVDYMTVVFDRLKLGIDRILLGKPFGAQAYYALLAGYGVIEPAWDRYGSSRPGWTYIMDRDHPLVHYIDDTMGNAIGVACGVAQGCNARVYVRTCRMPHCRQALSGKPSPTPVGDDSITSWSRSTTMTCRC